MKYLLILFIFLFSAFANNNKEINFNSKEIEYLKNNPIIKVGFTDVFEPYIIKSPTGKLKGVIPDIYKLLNEKYNLNFDYDIQDWKTTLENLELGKIDLIPIMNYDIAKKKVFCIVVPL